MKEGRAAINVTFFVRKDRREEFLHNLQIQVTDAKENESKNPRLVQFVIGEDLEEENTFYLHLKYKYHRSSRTSAVSTQGTHFLAQKAQEDIFLHELFDKWQEFMRSDPFFKEPVSKLWLVAEQVDPLVVNIPNPKQTISKEQTVFCLNADLHVQSDYREEFLAVLENARQESIQEPLCVEYQYGESVTTPNVFHVHQEYIGENGGKEGFDIHAKTAHYKQYKEFAEKKPFVEKPKGCKFRASVGSIKLPSGHYNDSSSSTATKTAKRDIVFLDGGSGHELKERGINDGSFLAGLLANEKQPDIVRGIHHDFCQSGCHVVTTNSFVAVPDRMLEEGLVSGVPETAKERTRELIAAAVRNARAAVTTTVDNKQNAKVAGTVPPLTECYIGYIVPKMEDMVPTYQFLVSTLLEEKVDILLAETLSTSREARAIVQATALASERNAKYSQIPLWISMTIDDFNKPTTLRSGEVLQEAIGSILEEAGTAGVKLEAIGVNCASPLAVSSAIPCLLAAADNGAIKPPPKVLAYANAFQTTTSEWLASLTSTEDELINGKANLASIPGSGDYDKSGCMLPEVYASYAREWTDLGASIIGGCCGVSPLHMQAVTNALSPP